MSGYRPRVKHEKKCEYTCKSDRKKRSFEPVADEVVATFDPSSPEDTAESLWARSDSTVNAISANRGFAILRVGNGDVATATVDGLEAQEDIANVMPVMIDREGGRRYFLPDELTVQFAEEVSERAAAKILKDRGMEILLKQRTPGYFTVSVPEGKGLFESISELSKLDDVEFAEPSEVGLNDLLEPVKTKSKSRLELLEEDVEETEFGELPLDALVHRLDVEIAGTNGAAVPAAVPEEVENGGPPVSDVEALPTDLFFGRLWGLHNTGQTVNGVSGAFDADIDAPHAWHLETGSKQIVVAVIDTGVDLDHPDLKANILPRGNEDWDFADPNDNEPWDSGTHGTHVAGTVGARRNGQGVVGVAYGAWIMPIRVNLISGKNQNRADAINYVTQQAIKYKKTRRYVINCSWRMSGNHTGVRFAIQKAVKNNVVVVFAAGNADNNIDVTPQYPAIYPEVIAVAATDQSDQRTWFSNYGKKVDVAAPGQNIYSTIPNNTYGFKDGTSMAAPHVAGLAALVWSKNPYLTNKQVRKCIESTCDNIDAQNPGFVGLLGAGRINAYRAVRHCRAPVIRTRILRKFRFPQKNAGSSTGLSFIPGFPYRFFGRRPTLLFLTQKAGSERIFFLDPITGHQQRSIDPVANDTIGSLAWDGRAIRVANVTTGAGSINRINAFNGAWIGSLPAPTGRGEGLVVVGQRIFYSTITRIHELRASDGRILRSFPAPGGECRALTYGRGYLFSANSTTGKITVFNPWTMDVRGTINAPGGGNRQADGIAFDARRRILYTANQNENRIYALRVAL
jgi:subtilisin family serine protease